MISEPYPERKAGQASASTFVAEATKPTWPRADYVPPSHRLSGELPNLKLRVPTLCYALSKLMLFGQQMLLNQ